MLNDVITNSKAVLAYFSHENCSVCKVLKPKVEELLNDQFPEMKLVYVDTIQEPETAGQHRVFTVPTILIFFEGKEYYRFSRSFSLNQLHDAIERPYSMLL